MEIRDLVARAEAILRAFPEDGNGVSGPAPGLFVLRHHEQTETSPALYEPVVCLILQGRKVTTFGEERIRLGPGECLVVSHDLPVTARISRARPSEPYLAVVMGIEVPMLRTLYEEIGSELPDGAKLKSLSPGRAGAELLDAFGRLLELADNPLDAPVLAPLVRREIHYRMLRAPNGAMLRRLLRQDTHASQVAQAISLIRSSLREPIIVPELAKAVRMSPSSFHKHFRAVTSTTPLRYQKELRLLEARRLLQAGHLSVTDIAYDVGYESPNQFSREYRRKFGSTPSDDRRSSTSAV